MPRSPEENDRIRQSTKKKISAAAMELFMKQGYYTTSIGAIAKHAGISKGLLYNYYKAKEELLSEMVEDRIQEVVGVMTEAISKETPSEQLKFIVNGAIDNIHKKPEVHRFYLHLQTQPEDDVELIKFSQRIIEQNSRQFELQCKIFERMGETEPRKRSLYFSSVLQGIMLMISTYPQKFPREEIKKQIIREFCKESAL
ncbi:TetR/AcrR family transcriptional regulator [Paucisalibacillus sp. EB02]|uniref:TetR/AcrR family transcriptional regulator n=1 Tax=Paucisalibacillus sp. EB02 TaxID=1347087 RepID=UPI0004B17D86|nr:TetR/AcrR family transcriptional regulator [Paucisalibacillus sp. EB02]